MMPYTNINHYRFLCDAPDCCVISQIIAGTDIMDAARICERYNWHIGMGDEKPLFTYCPKHYGLGED